MFYWQQAGSITATGSGKTALALTSTGTTTGMTIGGDTTLYRSAANILRTDDLFQIDQNAVTINLGDFNTYGMGTCGRTPKELCRLVRISPRPTSSRGTGERSAQQPGHAHLCWRWPERCSRLDSHLGHGHAPDGSLNGNAIMDGTLPIGAFGFIFGGNNLLYNSGFEATAVADADPNSVALAPWDGWFFSNATPSLLTRPTTETVCLDHAAAGDNRHQECCQLDGSRYCSHRCDDVHLHWRHYRC